METFADLPKRWCVLVLSHFLLKSSHTFSFSQFRFPRFTEYTLSKIFGLSTLMGFAVAAWHFAMQLKVPSAAPIH
jgi:hypothetical protein